MGMNQRLIHSIVAIRHQRGVLLSNGDRVMPDSLLLRRNAEALRTLAQSQGIARWGTVWVRQNVAHYIQRDRFSLA